VEQFPAKEEVADFEINKGNICCHNFQYKEVSQIW